MTRFSIIGAVFFACFYFTIGFSQFKIQENKPPVVKIVTPTTNSTFSWNAIIPYAIHVSDAEDGDSEYDEINPSEVLLVGKYLKSSSEIESYLIKESATDYSSLVQMSRSTCFNCHKAKGTLIGPSFERIAAKYRNNPKAIEFLAEKIIKGGVSIWGDAKMPPHPGLEVAQVQKMVSWILENNSDPDKNYFTGIEGAIKTKERPESVKEKSVLVLTAYYTDQGLNKQRQNGKEAQNTLIIKSN